MFDKNIRAALVWDGSEKVTFPESMGTPKPTQMQGTVLELLAEVSGRSCYDSMGTGRSSVEFHDHLLQVKHWSVYEHGRFGVQFRRLRDPNEEASLLSVFLNRPGLVVTNFGGHWRICADARHMLEWHNYTRDSACAAEAVANRVFNVLLEVAKPLMPQILGHLKPAPISNEDEHIYGLANIDCQPMMAQIMPQEQFVTLYLSGSRGMSHEQVRHRFSMSQRSTRFCDETESAWVEHPLTTQFLAAKDRPDLAGDAETWRSKIDATVQHSRQTYIELVDALETFVKEMNPGLDKTSARKQARGAARGYLGNALSTEMMFTASVQQWKHMIAQRGTAFADAEIRVMYIEVLKALKSSRYGGAFEHYKTEPAKDGLGDVIVLAA